MTLYAGNSWQLLPYVSISVFLCIYFIADSLLSSSNPGLGITIKYSYQAVFDNTEVFMVIIGRELAING